MFENVLKELLSDFFVQLVLLVVIPLVIVPAVSWLNARAKQAWQEFEILRPSVAVYLETFAESAVRAAEQAGVADLIEDKKTYAMEVLDAWLTEYGFDNVDLRLIEAAVEKAVWDIFNDKSRHPLDY